MSVERELKVLSVRIEAKTGDNQGNDILGSGILWALDDSSKYMYAFTAAHVIFEHDNLVIRYWDKDDVSGEIYINQKDNIALHEDNNCDKWNCDKSILLRNDVAVIRCLHKKIEGLAYKLKITKDINENESLLIIGYPKMVWNNENSNTSRRKLTAQFDEPDNIHKFFNYRITSDLNPQDRNEDLLGYSGSGVFENNKPLRMIGIHSYGDFDVHLNTVVGMQACLIREVCQSKNWDLPQYDDNMAHTKPDMSKWFKTDDTFFNEHKKCSNDSLKDFLKGKNCVWSLISNGFIVKREVTQEVLKKISDNSMIGILGAGGEGKTTILMQVCYELNNKGYTVYWNVEQINKTFNMELELTTDDVVFVIDDASGDMKFEKFALEASKKGYKIIFAARENEWNMDRLKVGGAEIERDTEFIRLKSFAEGEPYKFAKLISSTMNIDKSEEEIRIIFEKNSEGFLLAAMLIAVYGKPLEIIIKDMLIKIGDEREEILKVLSIICYVESLKERSLTNLSITSDVYKILYEYYSIKTKEIKGILCNEVRKGSANTIRTRHPEISKIILKFLLTEEGSRFDINEILDDFIKSFYNTANNKGKRTIPQEIIKKIYPIMIAIMNDIYNNFNDFETEYIANNIADIYSYREDIWLLWGKLEIKRGNVGQDFNEEFTARWIFKRAIEKCLNCANVYIKAAELELDVGNTGEINKENSARWILKKGMEKCPSYESIYIKAAELEIDADNIGEINQENSARWILKIGMEKCESSENIYIKASELELDAGNIGEINQENSARWILRKGLEKSPNTENIYIKAAQLELDAGNVGEINQENSARWILKKGLERCLGDANICISAAQLEVESDNIGEINQENSARWILKRGLERCPSTASAGSIYAKVIEVEINKDNIGEIDIENSARWYINQYLNLNINNSKDYILSLAALMEAHNNNFNNTEKYLKILLKISGKTRDYYVAYLCYKMCNLEEVAGCYKKELSYEDIENCKKESFIQFKLWEKGWIERMREEKL
ncbi:hypothetical protein Ccar_05550 [Clostridium carboxidivorans P7]|uniref:RNA-processing protein HAT helix repeating-containing protein n=1 Tax=Clostridium carboxidivorans P7 TaxID=536227 RepID=C6PPT3_9CLOT|nr:hypothetical protein [Clostridium carboxidivorans]AKN30313.1 hypothetical protein Ccar_05550 [Clostridium carboxidivorans P7]EET88813.1 RNA-processing protein HAT helix repeating-containing protein [Clostridium carboxidivorans P7]